MSYTYDRRQPLVLSYDRRTAESVEADLEVEGKGTSRGWETRREREEAIERNIEAISPHFKTLWRKLKHQFKGTPQSREEQFLQYVHDHPGEDMDLLQSEADKDLAKLLKEMEHRHWKPEPLGRRIGPSPVLPEREDDIPF